MGKHFLSGGLMGALIAGVAILAWTPHGGARLAPSLVVKPDTARDSLLVSDDQYQGWKWYHVYCFRCHGEDAIGGMLAPDLRIAIRPDGGLDHQGFFLCAWDGRLAKGMPSWKVLLDSSQIEQVYDYVLARSMGGLMPGRPHRQGETSNN